MRLKTFHINYFAMFIPKQWLSNPVNLLTYKTCFYANLANVTGNFLCRSNILTHDHLSINKVSNSFRLNRRKNCRKSQGMHKQANESGRNRKNSCHMIRSLTDRETSWYRFVRYIRCTVLAKVLGTVLQYSYFSVISCFPLKTVHPFWKFSCSSPSPHRIQSWNLEKILDACIQHCLWGEGRGWSCVNWKTPQKRKSVPRLLSMIVGCIPLGWSGSGSLIRDHSDYGRSNEPMNPWVHYSGMIRIRITDQRSLGSW